MKKWRNKENNEIVEGNLNKHIHPVLFEMVRFFDKTNRIDVVFRTEKDFFENYELLT